MPNRKVVGTLWESFQAQAVPKDASAIQIEVMRDAFYAGAGSIFATIVNQLEPGAEATQNDLDMMCNLNDELKEFGEEVIRRAYGAKGK
jgi:hypothetical protein